MSIKNNFTSRLQSGVQDSWCLVRSPDMLYLGLKKKWLVPTLLLFSLVLVPIILLPTTHLILEKIYPPVVEKQLFGLIKSTKDDERLEARKALSTYFLWSLAGLGVTFGFILYAPIIKHAAESEKVQLFKSLQRSIGGKASFDLDERYQIAGEIGSGAMGVVYSAYDKTLERNVALKELPTVFVRDPERRERFRREALTLAKLTHPGIVHIYDLLDDNQRMVLVMELVNGGTLEDLIAREAPFPEAHACRLVGSICETLEHVHQKGIIHRDLKPANILIDDHQNLKVTDFGLARLLQNSDITLDGSIFGSPNYMSSEQAAGKTVDYRSDIYSLGSIFYELLTGSPPFNGEPVVVLGQQITKKPIPVIKHNDDLNEDLSDLVMGMLVKNPDDRLVDYQEIQSRLQSVQIAIG